MNQLFLDIKENSDKLLERLVDFLLSLSDEKVLNYRDSLLLKIKKIVNDSYEAISSLDFINETELLLIDLYNRFSFKNEESWIDGTRAITTTLKKQLIALDQQRQSYFVFQ
jgi:hypothetical protein